MRFDFFFGGVFWGSLLILLGISIILKVIFNINIPIFRIGFALVLILFGIKMLTGISFFEKYKPNVIFDEQTIKYNEEAKEYNTVFAKSNFDFSDVKIGSTDTKVELNTVFAATELVVNPEIPTIITINSVFADAKMPDGTSVSFGEIVYKSPSYKPNSPALYIDINVVFGGIKIFENRRI